MQKIELLAPAGSYEAFEAAVQNGANAVYLGGNVFSARAFAANFSNDEIVEAVKYAHLRGVRVYITVNTLFQDVQLEEVMTYITFLYHAQVDALIIQDVGLVKIVKEYFPDFEIHMSTQASIHNLEGVRYFEELGIERVVLSRENTIEEISDICQNTNVDIEVFVHGALCVSYSGQCLMSSYIGKRSGNKGMCAQPCRLAYRLKKDNQYVDKKELYLLSPRDLCTIENIDQLIDAGVTSFKIEGRMKRPEYVATIVSKYRKVIDQYLEKHTIEKQDDAIIDMKKMFNRGFTKGYLFHDKTFMARQYPGNRGVIVGTTVGYHPGKKRVSIQLQDTLKQNDRIVFENTNDFTRTITKLYKQGQLVNSGQEKETVEIELDTKIAANVNVYKVIDSELLAVAKNSYREEHCKIPITISFIGNIGEKARIQISDGIHNIDVYSSALVEQAISSPLTSTRIIQQLQKLGGTVYTSNDIAVDFEQNGTLPIKEINQMRREAIKALNTSRENIVIHKQAITPKMETVVCKIETKKELVVKVINYKQLEIAIDLGVTTCYFPIGKELKRALDLANDKAISLITYTSFLTPKEEIVAFINNREFTQTETVMVGDYGALQLLKEKKKCILDISFNVYNSKAIQFFEEYEGIVLSQEMSSKQIRNLKSSVPITIFQAYGKVENMISKYCPISEHHFNKKVIGCNRCKEGKYALVDRKKESFVIEMDEYCNMHLLNCYPLYIDQISMLPVQQILLSFHDEDENSIKSIIIDYLENIMHNKKSQNKTNVKYTTGYFND